MLTKELMFVHNLSDFSAVPAQKVKQRPPPAGGERCNGAGYYALKLSFRPTARLNTRWPGAESLLSAQK